MIWSASVAVLAAGSGMVVWWLRRHYLIVTVLGRSMLPGYADGDRVLVRRVRPDQLRVGDVVVVDLRPCQVTAGAELDAGPGLVTDACDPAGSGGRRSAVPPLLWTSERVVKRVAALPGDPVPPVVAGADADLRVPAGRLVLLGDNPAESADSRQFGYVAAQGVVGVVLRHLRQH